MNSFLKMKPLPKLIISFHHFSSIFAGKRDVDSIWFQGATCLTIIVNLIVDFRRFRPPYVA